METQTQNTTRRKPTSVDSLIEELSGREAQRRREVAVATFRDSAQKVESRINAPVYITKPLQIIEGVEAGVANAISRLQSDYQDSRINPDIEADFYGRIEGAMRLTERTLGGLSVQNRRKYASYITKRLADFYAKYQAKISAFYAKHFPEQDFLQALLDFATNLEAQTQEGVKEGSK